MTINKIYFLSANATEKNTETISNYLQLSDRINYILAGVLPYIRVERFYHLYIKIFINNTDS